MKNTVIVLIILVVLLALVIYLSLKNPAKNRLTKLIRALIILALLIAIVVISVKEFGPKGRNPIFSESGRGENTGTDDKQTYDEATGSEQNSYAEAVVSGFTVILNGVSYDCSEGIYDELDEAISQCAHKDNMCSLRDEFGVSAVYHHVKDELERSGVTVVEVSE